MRYDPRLHQTRLVRLVGVAREEVKRAVSRENAEGKVMARALPEWIAKHDDQKIPDRVKVRILERENFTCHLTGQKIDPLRDEFDFDHKVSLILGGEHRENNLFPALRVAHRRKTATEVAVKSKIARVKKKHLLGKDPSRGFKTRFKRRMDGTVIDTRTGEVVSGRPMERD